MTMYGVEPQKNRYRPLTPTGVPHPGNSSKPIDQVGTPQMRPHDQTAYRKGQYGMPPQAPPAQRPGEGVAQRPSVGGPRMGVPPVPPPAPPSVVPPKPIDPGVQQFDTNLRSDVYTPGDDPRLAAAQKSLDTAAGNVLGGESYGDLASGAEDRYRKMLGSGEVAVGGMGENVPNRTELAKRALADFDQQGESALQGRFRAVGQKAAAMGRIGAGMTTSELGDVQSNYERDRMQFQNQLARDVSEGDIGDRFRKLEFETGVNERNADRSFDRERSAIDYAGRDADRTIGDRYDRLNAANTLESRLFGQGQSNRDEFRAERGRQDALNQVSLDNRIRERGLESQDKRDRLAQALALMQAGGKTPNLESLLG